MLRIVAVWAMLLSLENAWSTASSYAHDTRVQDWLEGQFIGVPFAIAVLAPAAVMIVILARLIVARRALVVGAVVALAAMVVAIALTTGPTVAALDRRIPFVLSAAAVVFLLTYVLVRKVPLGHPRVLAVLGAAIAFAAWQADRRVLPGLYPPLHMSFMAVTLAGSAMLALLIPARPRTPARPHFQAGAWALAIAWTIANIVMLNRNEHVRHALLQNAPILGRMVFVSSQLPYPSRGRYVFDTKKLDSEVARISRAREFPRALDWSGCDILVVTVDALRADHLGVYGYARTTSPEIDKLAAHGARFERAYTSAPSTSYAIASLMAGRNMRPVLTRSTGADTRTWPEYLRELDYETVGIFPWLVFGGPTVEAQHFLALREKSLGFQRHIVVKDDTKELRHELSSYLSSAPTDRPLFVWVHVMEPHAPYEMHAETPFPGGRPIDAYDSEIAAADAFIGSAVSLIESRGRCSAIIVTADHGEAFGEHGASYHGTTVYEEQVRVPLIVVAPGVVTGVISRPVQLIDLLPTILSALGQRRPDDVVGRDLSHLLAATGLADDPGFAFAETARHSMVALDDHRLICDREARTCALYDLATDPEQRKPVRDRPRRERLLRQLTAARGTVEDAASEFPLRIPAASPHFRRGNVTMDGDSVIATGEQGTLVSGPYMKLPAGAYEIKWTGTGIPSPGELVFSVRVDLGREDVVKAVLSASEIAERSMELIRIPFTLDRTRHEVELVVESRDGARVVLEQVLLHRTSDDSRADATSFPLRLAAMSPQLKRGHVTLDSEALVATGEPGTVVYGPYLELSRGVYELVWLGSGMGAPGQIAFSVRGDGGRKVFAHVVFDATNLSTGGGELVRLQFALDRAWRDLEFVVESSYGGRVVLDELVLEKKVRFPLFNRSR